MLTKKEGPLNEKECSCQNKAHSVIVTDLS